MKIRFIGAALALSSFAMFGSPALAQEDALQKAVQAYNQDDDVEALKWYRLSAEQGNANAQFMIGLMYDRGEGVPENDAEAVKWYRLAAEQGDAEAQYNLGNMYANGEGVPEDLVQAYRWFNLAAAQGNEDAKANKQIALQQMTPPQKAEARKLLSE